MFRTVRYEIPTSILFVLAVMAGGCGPRGDGDPSVASEASVCIAVTCPDHTSGAIAAGQLRAGLADLYPSATITISGPVPTDGVEHVIYVGTPETLKTVAGADAAVGRLLGPESYVVTTAQKGGDTVGLIVGADYRGVAYGVHGLLRKLGFGYALDGDIKPVPSAEPFSFKQWDLADRPLVPRRFVFNWHNFLSGCSSWDLAHWARWTTQSQKMGYNGIMVHAYGNNPMAGFAFEGADKPVGYLSSTRIGRDWATMHVNDVRRLIGGEVFDGPTLGSQAAVGGTDRQRTEAAQKLMAGVFARAEQRGVDVILAVDIDTDTANPQSLITKLPASARFKIARGGGFWLPRADTPEGYGYYKAQLAHLLNVYPQLDTFVMWYRQSRTPLMGLKVDQLPQEWGEEYRAIIASEPKVEKYRHSVGLFVIGKIAAAHQKALKELGRDDVTLGLGSWGFSLQAAGDRFMPKGVGLYPLDYEVLWKESRLESPGGPEGVATVAGHRPVYPIHWAHHDDLTYVGPPYPPFEKFHDLLTKSKCDKAGYGVLHWTTRPLDVFFTGLSDAVWASSRNQSVKTSCRRMAVDMLGEQHAEVFGEYLHQWLIGLPMIGRDTSDYFIDRELKGYDQAAKSHKQRMGLLDTIDQTDLSPVQRKRIDYFRGLERFIMSVFENEAHYRDALGLHKDGDYAGARKALGRTDVPAAIRLYADTAGLLGVSRGEQGLVVSLNLRWLTHYVCLAQQLGSEPIRINFAPTTHDMLAQNRGRFTYFIDRSDDLWEVRGMEETKSPAYGGLAGRVRQTLPSGDALRDVRQSGLESDQPIRVRVSPLMNRKNHHVPPGRYRLTLLFGKSRQGDKGSHVFDAAVHVPGVKTPLNQRVTLNDLAMDKIFDIDLAKPGVIEVILTPVQGTARISGLLLSSLPVN
jgi:hypothetical protein